jgi:hypothetical protein
MNNRLIRRVTAMLFLALTGTIFAAETRTEHTWGLSEGEQAPVATLEDAGWLAGSWSGTAFGSRFEEVWNAPSADSMVGMFKLLDDDGVKFYELVLMTVEDNTLSLKVKHFNADFTSWEDKEDFVDFRLVKKEENALHFGGLSFYRRNDDLIDAYVVMKNEEELTEHHLVYKRN